MMIEIPFPIPFSVIRSPNHMIKSVEDVKIINEDAHQNVDGLDTAPGTFTTVVDKYPGA